MLERLLKRGRPLRTGDDPIPAAYKPWIVASVAVLVLSLALGALAVVAAFIQFGEKSTPLWVIALGAASILGVITGFSGLFLLLATAGFRSWKDSRRVRVLPPE